MIFFCPKCASKLDSTSESNCLLCHKCDCKFRLIIEFIEIDSHGSKHKRIGEGEDIKLLK